MPARIGQGRAAHLAHAHSLVHIIKVGAEALQEGEQQGAQVDRAGSGDTLSRAGAP